VSYVVATRSSGPVTLWCSRGRTALYTGRANWAALSTPFATCTAVLAAAVTALIHLLRDMPRPIESALRVSPRLVGGAL
jgi:hypothetical protein